MRIEKKNTKGNWAKVGEDVVDEGTLNILDGGEDVAGEFGVRTVFLVKTKNGDKNLAFNRTSLNNLVDAFGNDTTKWIGNVVKSYVVKQMIGDSLKRVVYLCGLDWEMTDDGKFIHKTGNTPQHDPNDDIPVIEVNGEPVPF